MKKLDLNEITLVLVDCVNRYEAIDSINISTYYANFNKVKYFTHYEIDQSVFNTEVEIVKIPQIKSIEEYNSFILYNLIDYIETEYMLITQHDGFILNPNAWVDDFLNYDYIGAVWDLESYVVGNGGFSLRTKKIMENVRKVLTLNPYNYIDNRSEDFIICGVLREYLEKHKHIKYSTIEIADKFSVEDRKEWKDSFGFHSFKKVDIIKNGWEKPNIIYRSKRFLLTK